MAQGIKDKVAIIGMGCSRFGERWNDSAEDLMVEAFQEAIADAGIGQSEIGAAWFGTSYEEIGVGKSSIPLASALRLQSIPVTRVENLCASGSEAVRGAAYAVASGACDIALALGVEKLKDTGYGGLPVRTRGSFNDLWMPSMSAPGMFAQLASAYTAKHGADPQDLKRALAHISVKSHRNGALNPKAHLRKEISEQQALGAPIVAEPLGIFDCCGVSDGAACAIVATPEIAAALGKKDIVTIKAMQLAVSDGSEMSHNSWDGTSIVNTRTASARAYKEAGISDPSTEIGAIEVHDCFSITEMVTMEDLGFSKDGEAITDILDGRYDHDGTIPCQIDGGLKCFGHPIGASGIRMMYEIYLQLLGRADARQLKNIDFGLTHNLGGAPVSNVASVNVLGRLR
ncbi:MAG: acetyl-CoA acetyltransferase [Rhodospirillales bacterium]|jgi:acetyl-CoA C-acetyltransferase|uniref:acetyl-CoA acetyltransferase n=1 Tax=Hwanghaeella sp. 1Z406 TaxID=3402811 RepID=UPI000C9615F0|nr:acetyl-CoA acetyltransferase [Rhodospirillales bacterium]|tara:strand:- start:70661 stop:71860 length:1200 start_codon:yes stop_codon:yes gene_type:complete